ENVMRDLEKTLDLDSFGQVQISGIGASTIGTSQQPTQEISTLAREMLKGKELETSIQTTEQSTMSKKLEASKEHSQIPTPPTQTNVEETPNLQTPLNEERNKKRYRETTTPTNGP